MLASLRASLLLLCALLCLPVAARATPTTFVFSGTCGSCGGTGQAELTLNDYAFGQRITAGNFVSFHFDGAGTLAPFTIVNESTGSYGGSLASPTATGANLFLMDDDHFFVSLATGSWYLGAGAAIADTGSAGSYAMRDQVAVPEPVSAVLLGTGLLGMGLFRRPLSAPLSRPPRRRR